MVAFLVMQLTGWWYLYPAGLFAQLTDTGPLGIPVIYILAPLFGALLWRRPWWGRWVCLGFLLLNVAATLWYTPLNPFV